MQEVKLSLTDLRAKRWKAILIEHLTRTRGEGHYDETTSLDVLITATIGDVVWRELKLQAEEAEAKMNHQ